DWRVDRYVVAHGENTIREGGGDVCRGRGVCGNWLGMERVLPDQQGALDQFVRNVHGRFGVAVSVDLLLANRYQRIPALGQAVRSLWTECDRALRGGGFA